MAALAWSCPGSNCSRTRSSWRSSACPPANAACAGPRATWSACSSWTSRSAAAARILRQAVRQRDPGQLLRDMHVELRHRILRVLEERGVEMRLVGPALALEADW